MNNKKNKQKIKRKKEKIEKNTIKENKKKTIIEKREKTKKLAVKTGIGFSIMQNFSTNFFDAFAIALGFSAQTVSLITSIPQFLNSILQLFTYKIIKKTGRHKTLYYSAILQSLLLVLILILGYTTKNYIILILLFTIFFFLSNIIAVSWISIIGDVLKKDEKGKYLSYRNKIINIVSLISLLIAGTILNYLQKIISTKSFIAIFTIAIIARIYTYFILKQYYVPKTKELTKKEEFTLIQFIKKIKKSNFVKYTLTYSFLIYLMYLFATTISFYRLEVLKLNYFQFTLFKIIFIIGMILSYSYWGKISDKYGNKILLVTSTLFKSIIITLWAIITNIPSLYVIEFFSGIFHSAFLLGGTNYFLDAVTSKKRIIVRPYFNFFVGVSILLAGLTSSNFIKYYNIIEQKITLFSKTILFNNPFQTIFLISGILRFIVVILFLIFIKELRKEKEIEKLKNKIKRKKEKIEKNIKKTIKKEKNKILEKTKKIEEKAEKPFILLEHHMTRIYQGFIHYNTYLHKNKLYKNKETKRKKNNKIK